MNSERILDISWGTILKLAITTLVLYILYLIRDILIWFVFALIISILFNPAINFLEKRKIPRVLAVVFIYLSVFGLLGLLLYFAAFLFISEIQQFSQLLPQYFEKFSPLLRNFGFPIFENVENFIQVLGENVERVARGIGSILFATFGGIIATIFTITMAIFISLEKKPIERTLILFFPKKYEAFALNLWVRCQKKVSGWLFTRLIASAFVGILTFFALFIFKARYLFSLSVLAGLLNFIPVVGPIITGAIIFLVISFDNLLRAIFVLIVFTLIQQVENNILSPILSKKFIGLSPVLVLISLAIGGVLWGFLGAILAIPLAGILSEFVKEFLEKRKEEREKAVVL